MEKSEAAATTVESKGTHERYGEGLWQSDIGFVPGLKVSEIFYNEVVKLILSKHWPDLKYSAARVDKGSDVLGFDTERSMDHGWGARLYIFVDEQNLNLEKEMDQVFMQEFPDKLSCGVPTFFRFGKTTPVFQASASPDDRTHLHHHVTITTFKQFFKDYLGWDYEPGKVPTERDWLIFEEHRLKTLTEGRVYHDDLELEKLRKEIFGWYPTDVWKYLLMCEWRKIVLETPQVGRTGDVGDSIGSRIIAGQRVRDCMRICFLLNKVYPPYSKWFGTAFSKLECVQGKTELFEQVFKEDDWEQREEKLNRVYEFVGDLFNKTQDLNCKEVDPTCKRFHGRPYFVPPSHAYIDALRESIDPESKFKDMALIGSINQFSDSVELVTVPTSCLVLSFIEKVVDAKELGLPRGNA